MDSNLLVRAGHKLIDVLEAKGIRPRAAMWVHNTDVDTWKLWIVPPKGFKEERAFYRKVAEAASENRDVFGTIDASYVEMVPDTHPAIQSLSKFVHITNKGSAFLQNNRFNNFYLAEGIVLLMNL